MPAATTMLSIRRLSPAAAAEACGIDLTRPLGRALVQELHRALAENCLLVFRDAQITPEQHIEFSRQFGELETHVLDQFTMPGHPEILLVSNVKEDGKFKGAVYAGQYWHSDVSYMAKPPMGSLLLCREMPEIGGDTMWSNMYLAYETLSEPMQKFLGSNKAIHHYSNAYEKFLSKHSDRPPLTPEQRASTPPVTHPMVRTHPVTGRKALYVNPGFTSGIEGMPADESQPILDFLFQHSTRPEFVYRHKWRVNDIVFWDNRCTMHYALADYDFSVRRHMHRTTVVGELPR